MGEKFLARHTTASLFTLLGGKKPVIGLVPIGSTEPHGPHLGLGTDVVISAAAWGLGAIQSFDNTKNSTVIYYDENHPYTPKKYTRVHWSEPTGGAFYVCELYPGADTKAAAEALADPTPFVDGTTKCGAGTWQKLTKK